MTFRNFSNDPFQLVYDNEGKGGDGDGDGDGKGGDGRSGDDDGGGGGDSKLTFTQPELNKLMADNRRKLTTQNATLVQELSALKDQANLTTTEKEELEGRIEALQTQFLSKEELAKRASTKSAKEHEALVTGLKAEGEAWKGLYTKERVTTALTTAAIEAKATVPGQIVALLESTTYLAEKLGEDGKPTGEFVPMVKFQDTNEEGKPVTLDLAPAAALKRMQELPDAFGNLFINPGTGGMGGDSGSSGGKGGGVTIEQLKDPAFYAKWRKENPGADPTKVG